MKDSAKGDVVPRLTVDFVRRRVRRLIDLDPTLQEPGRPGELTAAGTTTVRAKLVVELPKVRDAHKEIWKRVDADPDHLNVDLPDILAQVSTRPPARDARVMRRLLVATIVYQGAAFDITLADPGSIDRLHVLCDRRLRIVERMLYDVGRVEKADILWRQAQIDANPGGPWIDGKNRIFEYPRVPEKFFLVPCRPDPTTGACQAPMTGWRAHQDTGLLIGPMRTNPLTTAAWRPDPADPDKFNLLYTAGSLADAVTAVLSLFTPSTNFLDRNLLFCDQVIHALQLEALVFSRQKRQPAAKTWLDTERAAKPAGWLRISSPFGVDKQFLASKREPAHFEFATVRATDLQPGDHLIIFNHPAYENATIAGAWKLENAVVVQSHPKLLMQGHGSLIHDMDGMKRDMVFLFNRELDQRRADVEGLATVVGTGPNRLRVNSLKRLRVGMRLSIADPSTDSDVASDRKITAINTATSTVTYDGTNVASAVQPGFVLRRNRRIVHGFEEISFQGVTLRCRVPVHGLTTFRGRHQRADWHLSWDGTTDETAIRLDPARRAFVRQHQLVDYEVDPVHGEPHTRAWFPLWKASTRNGLPIKTGALISATEPVVVKPENVAGWTWFMDPNLANSDLVAVLRPREP